MTAPPTLPDAALKRAPTREALATMAAAVRPGSRIGMIRRLRGGISSGMHLVELVGSHGVGSDGESAGADGERLWVVVRRYGAWRLRRYPKAAEQEWATLTALARVGAPTPLPIWLDTSGDLFGCPTIVTSRVPGRGLLAPRDLDGWIRQLAEALARIHAAPLHGAELALLTDQHEALTTLLEPEEPPADLADRPPGPEVWRMMRRWLPRIQPAATPVIVHGDFWPGNTLWRYGRLTGVIDWEQVRRGDPTQDVGCCRQDLTLLIGPEAADAFTVAYLKAGGPTPRRLFFWELYQATWAIEGLEEWVKGYHDLGRTDITPESGRARLEQYVAGTLAQADAALIRADEDETSGS